MPDSSQHQDLGILLTMIYIAWVDKKLTHSELETIKEEMQDQGLDREELNIVHNAVVNPPNLDDIAEYLTDEESRMAALTAAYVVAFADESLEVDELNSLDDLASTFGISKDEQKKIRNFVEDQIRHAREGRWEDAMLLEKMEIESDL